MSIGDETSREVHVPISWAQHIVKMTIQLSKWQSCQEAFLYTLRVDSWYKNKQTQCEKQDLFRPNTCAYRVSIEQCIRIAIYLGVLAKTALAVHGNCLHVLCVNKIEYDGRRSKSKQLVNEIVARWSTNRLHALLLLSQIACFLCSFLYAWTDSVQKNQGASICHPIRTYRRRVPSNRSISRSRKLTAGSRALRRQ